MASAPPDADSGAFRTDRVLTIQGAVFDVVCDPSGVTVSLREKAEHSPVCEFFVVHESVNASRSCPASPGNTVTFTPAPGTVATATLSVVDQRAQIVGTERFSLGLSDRAALRSRVRYGIAAAVCLLGGASFLHWQGKETAATPAVQPTPVTQLQVELDRIRHFPGVVSSVDFAPEGDSELVGYAGGMQWTRYVRPGEAENCRRRRPDEKLPACVPNAKFGQNVQVRGVGKEGVNTLAVLSTGSKYSQLYLLTGGEELTLKDLYAPNGYELNGMALSADQKRVAYAYDKGCEQVELKEGKMELGWSGKTNAVALRPAPAHAEQPESMLCAAEDGVLYLVARDQPAFPLQDTHEPARPLRAVAVSPDGRQALAAGEDKIARLWDLEKKRIVWSLEGHTKAVLSVAFSPNGKWLATGSEDGSIRLWDRERGTELAFKRHNKDAVVTSVAFSPDSHQIASGGRDRAVRFWRIRED